MTAVRRICLAVCFVMGGFWLVSALVLSYFGKTEAVDRLRHVFRATFSAAGVRSEQRSMATVNAFAKQFQSQALPALAKELHTTPGAVQLLVAKDFPAVGKGLLQLPTILPYFNRLVGTIAAQQSNFHQVDSIPVHGMPAVSVFWLFVILGIVSLGLGAAGIVWKRWSGPSLGVLAVVGVVVIAVTFVIAIPTKTQAAVDFEHAFAPVFTPQAVAQTQSDLATVAAMDRQLASATMPALAGMLHMAPATFEKDMVTTFPAIGAGLTQLPGILTSFRALTGDVQANIGNFRQAEAIATKGTDITILQAQLVVPAAVLIAGGLIGLLLPLWLAAATKPRAVVVDQAGVMSSQGSS